MKKNVEITNRLKQTFNKKNQPIYNCFKIEKNLEMTLISWDKLFQKRSIKDQVWSCFPRVQTVIFNVLDHNMRQWT